MEKPDILTFEEILHNKIFEIPEFQRAYSWEESQVTALLSDISPLIGDVNKRHFMSTIVCLKQSDGNQCGTTSRFSKMQVVDGQQRLTTLIILLKTICLKLKEIKTEETVCVDDENEYDLQQEYDELRNTLFRGLNGSVPLLQTNHQSRQMFESFLSCDEYYNCDCMETLAEVNLNTAISVCRKYVEENTKQIYKLLSAVKNQLQFIFYTVTDEKEVYTIFEVLNSRGMPVSSFDKCKSMLMGVIFEKYEKEEMFEGQRSSVTDLMHKIWTQIYKIIGRKKIKSEEELLRVTATLLKGECSKLVSEQEALTYFNLLALGKENSSNLTDNQDVCVSISQLFLKVAEQLLEFFDETNKFNSVIDISQVRFVNVAIGLSEFTDEEKSKIKEVLEKISFRIYGLFGKDSRYKVGDFIRLGISIYKRKYDLQSVLEELKRIGSDFLINEDIKKQLLEQAWYPDSRDEIRYILYKYEMFLEKEDGTNFTSILWNEIWAESPDNTIEHICPETFNDIFKKNWSKLGVKSQDELNKFVHKIGNLTLLPLDKNSKLKQNPFSDKKITYQKKGMCINIGIINKDEWNIESIEERSKEIIDFICKEWSDD